MPERGHRPMYVVAKLFDSHPRVCTAYATPDLELAIKKAEEIRGKPSEFDARRIKAVWIEEGIPATKIRY